jgi:hypothetical protein
MMDFLQQRAGHHLVIVYKGGANKISHEITYFDKKKIRAQTLMGPLNMVSL